MMKRKGALVAIAFFIICNDVVRSTHFRGGSMTWRAVEVNNEMKAEIDYKLAYQIDTDKGDNDCTWAKYLAQAEMEGDDQLILALSANGTVTLGMANEVRTSYTCTERHEAADYPGNKKNSWIIGENKHIINLESDVKQFIILWKSCCWVDLENYIVHKNWNFRMTVNLASREDTHAINNPPQATGIPVKVLSKGCPRTRITIPVIDSDGDDVRCRWVQSKKGECEENCGGPSSKIKWTLQNTQTGCRLSVTPGASTPGWYGVPIMLEDFNDKGEVLSSVPFQFMLRIVNKETCPKPEIVSPVSDCLIRQVGEEFNITLAARAVTPGSRILSIMTTGLLGMSKSEIRSVPERPEESYVIVTWTPPRNEEGRSNILCFQPEDSNGFQGEMNCIDLFVGERAGPVPDPTTSRPSTGHKIHKSETVFIIRFDKRIKRPATLGEIRFLHADDGSHLLTVPVEPAGNGHDVAVVYYDDEIVFAIPEGHLQENQTYRIELPEGLAGESGTEACRLPSGAATWDFSVVGELKAINKTPISRKPTPYCYETYMKIFILKSMVPYEDPKHVYFREPACIARVYNATHFVMRTDYQFCGTNIEPQSGTGALVTNDIRIIQQTVGQSDSVTRGTGSLVHIVCRVDQDQTFFVSLDTDIGVTTEDTWEGVAVNNFSLVLYEDESYTRPYGYSSYPVHAPLGEKLYFQASRKIIPRRNKEIYLRSCTATPYPNPDDRLSHQFIDNNCPVDDTVTIQRISGKRIKFSIESFAFLHHFLSESISVHCKVWLRNSVDMPPPCAIERTQRYAGQ